MKLRALAFALSVLAAAGFNIRDADAQALIMPPGKTCFQAVTGINGMVGTLGTITPGSGGSAGTYVNVSLTGGSGSGATANITVSGGGVTAVNILNPGINYVVGDVLSAASGTIGGVSSFSVPVASIAINSSLAGGTVGMYIPGTLTPSQTWQNAAESILNTNPIALDSNGCALIWGQGSYRQIVYDSFGNEVWDAVTTVGGVNPYYAGAAGGTANAITLTDSSFTATNGSLIQFVGASANTGSVTINAGTGALTVYKAGPSGPTALVGGEIQPNTDYMALYVSSVSGGGAGWFLYGPWPNLQALGVASTSAAALAYPAGTAGGFALFSGGGTNTLAGGRLTLNTHTPVMAAAYTAKTTLYYDSFVSNGVPYYNGAADQTATITGDEVSDTLPATGTGAINASTVFDEFWSSAANGICHVTNGSGGGWAADTGGSNTARGTGYSQLDFSTRPYPTNANAITYCYNGSTVYAASANQLTYLGTCATESVASQLNFNPQPAAAAGGALAQIDCWNYYNRQPVVAQSRNTSNPTVANASWTALDASSKISFVQGVAGYVPQASAQGAGTTSNTGYFFALGLGLDTTTSATATGQGYYLSSDALPITIAPTPLGSLTGFHFVQLIATSGNGSAAATFYAQAISGYQNEGLYASLNY